MLGCVHLNIMIKTLREIYKTLLYMVANVSIKPNWETLIEFTNAYENKQWQKDKFEKKKVICMLQIILRKLLKKIVDIRLVQGILNLEEIINDDIEFIAIALE